MPRPGDRTADCSITEGRARFFTAEAYLQTAERILAEANSQQFSNVVAGNAVLVGIAASDAICCSRLGKVHRGDDHRAAGRLLASATPDGDSLATTLSRLLDVKDAAHYGASLVSMSRARDAIKWARKLVERARQEVER